MDHTNIMYRGGGRHLKVGVGDGGSGGGLARGRQFFFLNQML